MTKPTATVKQRRHQHRATIIEDILSIARQMMRKDGVAALSFNAIARQLGIQPPSLYTYFASKNAIYDELFRRGFLEFGRRMDEPLQHAAPLREKLECVMQAYLDFALENPDLYQLMFQRPVLDFVPSDASMAVSLAELDKAQRHFARILETEEIAIQIPIEEARDLFIALQHGLTELHLANNPDLPVGAGRFGKLVPQAVQLLLDAWQKR